MWKVPNENTEISVICSTERSDPELHVLVSVWLLNMLYQLQLLR